MSSNNDSPTVTATMISECTTVGVVVVGSNANKLQTPCVITHYTQMKITNQETHCTDHMLAID